MPTEYGDVAREIFQFYDEDSEMLGMVLEQFIQQPPMRDIVIEYLTGIK